MPQCKNFVMFTKEFTFKNFLRGKIKASKNVLSLSLIMIVCDKQTFFMFISHRTDLSLIGSHGQSPRRDII